MLAYSVAAIGGTAWIAALVVAVRAVLLYIARMQGGGQGVDDQWLQRLAALETTVAGLPSLWEEERERAERAKERARAHERRAAEILRSVEDDDDADDDVRGPDAHRGAEQGVLPLRPDMGSPQERQQSPSERAAAMGLTPWALAGL